MSLISIPTHELVSQIANALFTQRLGEDVCNLLGCINRIDKDGSITYKPSEMMVLDGNVLGPGCEFWTLCHCATAFVVFPDSTSEDRLSR